MKRLLIILLVLLSVINADAQRKKSRTKKKAKHSSVRHSSARRHSSISYSEPEPEPEAEFQYVRMGDDKRIVFTDPPEDEPKPFVLINDVVYNGKLQDLKIDDIIEVSVVKRKSARVMYGPKATAGAVLIKAKRLPEGLVAESPAQPKPRPQQKSFMFNEEVTYGNIEDIDHNKILSIDTLIQPKFAGSKENDTTLSVTTKVYGKKLYQWKFGTLSSDYKHYIRSRRGNDKGVNYVLSDGTVLTGGNEDDLIKLYRVYNLDIKTVTFNKSTGKGSHKIPTTVNIEINEQ